MSHLTFAVVFISTVVVQTSGYLSIRLDTIEDIFRQWKVNGDYLYYPNGALLETISSKLPSDFRYTSYRTTPGVWALFPTGDDNVHVNGTRSNRTLTTFSFSYQSPAQLLASVSVRHNLRGKGAKIFIRNSETSKPLFEIISDPDMPSYEWVNVNVPLDGSRFFIDGQVGDDGDYILIDRIEGYYMESTTSTSRPRTSTSSPKPLPYNSVSRISNDIFTLLLLLVSIIFVRNAFL